VRHPERQIQNRRGVSAAEDAKCALRFGEGHFVMPLAFLSVNSRCRANSDDAGAGTAPALFGLKSVQRALNAMAGVWARVAARDPGELERAFDGAAGIAWALVGTAQLGRRSYQAHDVEKALGLEGLGHADDCAHLVARGVVSGLSRRSDQDYGNAAEAIVALHDEAEIVTAHFRAFDFSDED
jgi:hypothetical protein